MYYNIIQKNLELINIFIIVTRQFDLTSATIFKTYEDVKLSGPFGNRSLISGLNFSRKIKFSL